ncbi:MAG: ATP-binding cassette domain-containing protein [Rhodobacter sp.]|nr:ATP-binding cassette domain-containing protein [Rhodobacter sp.]
MSSPLIWGPDHAVGRAKPGNLVWAHRRDEGRQPDRGRGADHRRSGRERAGKTTLLNTLAGVIDPFKGKALFQGEEIQGRDADEVARKGWSWCLRGGRSILPFGAREPADGRVRPQGSRCRRPRHRARASVVPCLKERDAQHAGLLSGGEQQMVAIGRAYMSAPASDAGRTQPGPVADAGA